MTKASLANPLPINFAQAMTDYQNLANGLSGLTGLAPSYVYQGQRGFTGTNSSLNVFNLDGPNVAQALTINAPGTSTVIVNVSGKSINWSNFGVSLGGIDRTKVLFNFYEATSITFTNIGLEGSLLAPTANLYLTNGSVNGNAIAQSWNTEITEPHWYPFAGNLPDVAQTPEPGTFFGCGIGCLLIARLATRAKK
jgi:choice-of-anchor A domain-containing protein